VNGRIRGGKARVAQAGRRNPGAGLEKFFDRVNHDKLKVNEAKSAVDRPRERGFLGFSIVRGGKIAVSEKARERVKARIRELTSRKRGCSLRRVISELATYLRGWKAYKQEPGAGHRPANAHFR